MFYKDTNGNIIAEVIDNYLPGHTADKLEEHFLSTLPYWNYQPQITLKSGTGEDAFFAFVIWKQPEGIITREFELLIPIVEQLNNKALLRIKANLFLATDVLHIHRPHQDYSFNHKSGVYYVNDNDGYTQVGDHKIESVKNRFLVFDGSHDHNSTNCTSTPSRVTLNFNWL